MSDEPPGLNAPRRKARFRSRYEQEEYRGRTIRRASEIHPASPEHSSAEEPAAEGEEPFATAGASGGSVGDALEAGEKDGEAVGSEQENLLPNFRLNKVYEPPSVRSNALKDWRWLLVTFLLLAAGVGGGFALGRSSAPVPERPVVVKEPAKPVVDGIPPEVQTAVDAAFQASKKGRYAVARGLFDTLHEQHPEWWSMAIESARSSLYLHDAQAAQRVLGTVTGDAGQTDVNFIQALLHLTNDERDLAEKSFALANAHDPTRPDVFFFWGECLRRDGKPREAVDKFRAALLRNQYENAEGLYQLKLWLSQIQSDQEESSGANAEINTSLASAHPSYEAFFAAAARELKAKNYPKAAEWIARAQGIMEPAVFRVIMQDPTFAEEAPAHPEIAAFYK